MLIAIAQKYRDLRIYKASHIVIPDSEIKINAIRAQGPGGQNVNKVSTAVHLRFDIKRSSLPEPYKEKLLNLNDRRISKEGIIIIKAQKHRSLEKNKEDALSRLRQLLKSAVKSAKKRKATKPTAVSERKRLDSKIKHGRLKNLRGRVDYC